MPSRICDLLSEFLEVLLLVIQPLSSVSGMYVNPDTFQAQMQEHSAQADYIRSVFDPALIEQELRHEVFDPSSLFAVIGTTLKGHCAPMRDGAVESMIAAAQACAPGGSGTKRDAVMALKMCMELLELMKLDIANHQLQTLRPFLLRTSGQFELKAFKNRRDNEYSLDSTRDWLRHAHAELLTRDTFSPFGTNSSPINYTTLSRNQQTYLAVIYGLVDSTFNPPPPSPAPPDLPPKTSATPRVFRYPETLYLDHTRLALLNADTIDALVMHLFLLLFRQLVHSGWNDHSAVPPKIQHTDLTKIKTEIRDIALARLTYCVTPDRPASNSRGNTERQNSERSNKHDIILQIARRAKEARRPSGPSSAPTKYASINAPEEHLVNLAQRWTDLNMRMDAPLAILSRRRLRDTVFHAVVAMVYPSRDSSCASPVTLESLTSPVQTTGSNKRLSSVITAELEPLTEELSSLAEKISRLVLIHLDTYLPLYEQANFLD